MPSLQMAIAGRHISMTNAAYALITFVRTPDLRTEDWSWVIVALQGKKHEPLVLQAMTGGMRSRGGDTSPAKLRNFNST